MAYYTPRNIGPADQILFDANGDPVGIQPAGSSQPPLMGLTPTEKAATQALVSGGGNRRMLRTVAIVGDSLSAAGFNPAMPAGVGAFDCTGISNLNSVGTWIVNPSFDGRGASGTAGTLSTDGAGRLQHNRGR